MKLLNASIFALLVLALQVLAWPAHSNRATEQALLRRHDSTFNPDIVLRVSYETVSIGCTPRHSALINGTLPGPEVRIPAGRTTWIRVYNDIPDKNTSMHWHGLSQRTAIFSDGSPSVSQWPIPPGHFFDYEVHPGIGDAGTYFYHSHVGFQMSTASGALIVEDAGAPPFEYDEERVILLGDYFNRSDGAIEAGLTATPFMWSGEVNAVLINGKGVPKGKAIDGIDCQAPMIHIDAGKTYRLRFVGATSLSMVKLAIVDHDFTIIAADGHYTKPYPVDYLQISSGQRYDVLLTSKLQHQLNDALEDDFTIYYQTVDREEDFEGAGVLRYSSGTRWSNAIHSIKPSSLTRPAYDWLEYALEPLVPNDFPTAAEVTRRVTTYARQLLTETAVWQLNGAQWNESTILRTPSQRPYLVDIYSQGPAAIPNYDAAMQNDG